MDNNYQAALGFFGFGMDREVPAWVPFDSEKPILHLGPGSKGGEKTPWAIDCEWPQYDFEDAACLRYRPLTTPSSIAPFRSFEDNSCGGVMATHVLEHLADPRNLIWEVARVLAPGCPFNIVVPKAGSNLFRQDLDHKSGFVLDTWRTLLDVSYYTKGKSLAGNLKVGFNMEMSIKEGNNVIVTQLIKI